MRDPIILAIDTSCDETSVAVLWGRRVLSNVLASQVELHKKYGGVYPIEAKRAHEEKIESVIVEALGRAWGQISKLQMTNDKFQRQASGTSDGIPAYAGRTAKKQEDDVQKMWELVDGVAVTQGPGLAPALEVGIRVARELVEGTPPNPLLHQEGGKKKKLIGVNHMEGHLLSCLGQNSKGKGRYGSNLLETMALLIRTGSQIASGVPLASGMTKMLDDKRLFPVLGLLVSGGHTELVRVDGIGKYRVIGQTVDDAAGECLDKVARMLGLGYPGGAIIEQLAKEGNPKAIPLPVPMKGKAGLEFSFSGLKTAALYEIRARQRGGDRSMPVGKEKLMEDVRWGRLENLDKQFICDMCASVQRVVVEAIILKVVRAIEEVQPSWVWLGGGVGANAELKKALRKVLKTKGIGLGLPYSEKLWGDNAGMIGLAGYFKWLRGEFVEAEELDRKPRLALGEA